MNNCDETKLLIEAYFSGEITMSNFRLLHRHIESCEYCRVLMELHFEATSDDQSIPMPSEIQLQEMRSSVLGQIARDTRTSKGSTVLQFPGYMKYWKFGMGIAAMLVIAVWFGRWSTNYEPLLQPAQDVARNSIENLNSLSEQSLIEQITHQATYQKPQQNLRENFWNNPIFYSNVSFSRVTDQSLKLGFDLCRRIDINAAPDSVLAREVMLHAILNPTTPAGQYKAMQVAATTQDNRLIEAMILTMHNDQALAVRIEAFSILSKMSQTKTIEDAFLHTLRDDSAVKMRLVVLKQLSGNYNLSREVLVKNIQQGSKENTAALFHAIRTNTKSVQQL